jgi:hypothetical protein
VTQQQSGELRWTLRAEFPIETSAPSLAADAGAGDGRVAFRWLVSLAPSF